MRGRDVTLGKAAVSRCTVSSDVFDGQDFASLRMLSGTDHWITLDPTVLLYNKK